MDMMWIITSEEFIKESVQNKTGKNKGKRSIWFNGKNTKNQSEHCKPQFKKYSCSLWPSGDTGVGSIPTRTSGYMQRLDESLCSKAKMSVGIKINNEVHMKAGNKIKTETKALNLKARLNLNFKLIVAVLVDCLMVAPLTRAYN